MTLASPRPPKVPRPHPVPRVRSELIDRLAPEDVPMFWEQIAVELPLIEACGTLDEVVVTFCWRDEEAEEVLLFANRLTDDTDLASTMLERLPGTDLWHASFRMRSDWRASYSFLRRLPGELPPWLVGDRVVLRQSLDQGRPDPLNLESCHGRNGRAHSVVALPAAPPQPWRIPRDGVPAGRLTRHEGPDGRDVWLYDPPEVEPRTALPLLVVLDGEVWAGHQDLPTTLDNLRADAVVPPLRALFVASGVESRSEEHSDHGSGVDYVAAALLPWAEEQRGVLPGQVAIAGQSLGGLTALRLGLRRPDLVSHVISQSASLWQDDLAAEVATAAGSSLRPRVHLAHGEQEWALAGPHRDLAERLRAGGVPVAEATYNGGHDYAWWRGAIADALVWLWGPAPS